MPRGRHSEPDSVQDAKGNPGRRKRKSGVSDSVASSGDAPRELSSGAKRIWAKLIPDLQNLRFIRDTDQMAFARYCEHAAHWWKCTKDIEKNGATYTTESLHGSMERLRPSFLVRERLEKHLVALEDRFGLNPVYRQQILQRMAGMSPPPPPGGLFTPPDANNDVTNDESVGSPIGLLRRASGTIN